MLVGNSTSTALPNSLLLKRQRSRVAPLASFFASCPSVGASAHTPPGSTALPPLSPLPLHTMPKSRGLIALASLDSNCISPDVVPKVGRRFGSGAERPQGVSVEPSPASGPRPKAVCRQSQERSAVRLGTTTTEAAPLTAHWQVDKRKIVRCLGEPSLWSLSPARCEVQCGLGRVQIFTRLCLLSSVRWHLVDIPHAPAAERGRSGRESRCA